MEEESQIGISSSTKPSYQEHCDLGNLWGFTELYIEKVMVISLISSTFRKMGKEIKVPIFSDWWEEKKNLQFKK